MSRWPRLWLARVEGPSMHPTLHPGDVVLIVRRRGPLRRGMVVVADVSGRAVIKRVAAVKAGRCRLGVEHPYAEVPCDAVGGRVIWALRPRAGWPWLRSIRPGRVTGGPAARAAAAVEASEHSG